MDIQSLNAFFANGQQAISGKKADTSAGQSFANLVGDALQGVQKTQTEAAAKTVALANGENIPMHEVVQAIGKAEMTLETMITVRDRAVEAYQEIIRMPI